MDLLDLATLLHLYVVNNLPLAFTAFAAFGMLSSAAVHDVARCNADVVIT